jgi:hypothetical protein
MDEKEALSRIVELLEAQNELLSEGNLLKGEILSSLDALRNVSVSVNPGLVVSGPAIDTVAAKAAAGLYGSPPQVEKLPDPDLDYVDPAALSKAMDSLTDAEVNVFWPKTKARKGWARVSIKHPNLESLTARVAKGCLCGKDIVVKKTDTSEFFTCEGVTKGGCDYRPAVYGDKMTFLTNLPPKKS